MGSLVDWPAGHRFLRETGPRAPPRFAPRAHVLEQGPRQRDPQFHERGKDDMAEVLITLEEQEWARHGLIEALRASDPEA